MIVYLAKSHYIIKPFSVIIAIGIRRDLGGIHKTALKGGQQVGYQAIKKHKTTNSLYLTDRQVLLLAMGKPFSDNRNDLYSITNVLFEASKSAA